jgi:hypothetical protein
LVIENKLDIQIFAFPSAGVIQPTACEGGRAVISLQSGRTSAWPKLPHCSQRNRRSIETKVISSGRPSIDMVEL